MPYEMKILSIWGVDMLEVCANLQRYYTKRTQAQLIVVTIPAYRMDYSAHLLAFNETQATWGREQNLA